MSQEVTAEVPETADLALLDMQSPTEKDGFQLDTINHYGTKAEDRQQSNNGVAEEGNGEEVSITREGVSPHEDIEDDEFIDPEQLGMKEKLLLRMFPWLLRWPWFKKKIFQKKTPNDKSHEQWDNRGQYILTLVGYAVGLGNIWRFSYLVAKNGGAAFIIPYLLMLIIVGIPMFYLESLLGQATQKGPILAWYKICPNLWGIGLSAVFVTVFISLYYNVIISWVILYFFNSFQDPLPWAKCDGYLIKTSLEDNFEYFNNLTEDLRTSNLASCINDSTRYFWYTNALEASVSIDAVGSFNWRIFLTLFAGWVVVYLCIFRGIKSSGKVVYFTATFPYLVLIILFFRAVTLKGAGDGLKFLFVPDVDVLKVKFFQPQVWLEAATQIFFSLGLSFGAIIALSSYSKPSSNSLVDTLTVCFANSGTSIFASIVVFSIVGFKANQLGIDPKLVSQGPGLAFIVFTEALTLLPLSPLWALLFFIMLFLLGLDSQFAGLEVIITVLYDSKTVRKVRKEIVVALMCLIFFACSFPFVLGNGLYLFQLFDQFAGTLPLLFIGFCEVATISYIFGVERFFDMVQHPIPRPLKTFWWFVWTFVSPPVMFIIFWGSVANELVEPLTYSQFSYGDGIEFDNISIKTEVLVVYPDWAQFIGALLVLTCIMCTPIVLIIRLISYHKARKQLRQFVNLTKRRIRNLPSSFMRCVTRRESDSWSPNSDGDVVESEIPYFSADESEVSSGVSSTDHSEYNSDID